MQNVCALHKQVFSEESMFFADSQLNHDPMMPIFESVQAIPPTDPVWKFERNQLSGSQVIVLTNTKKRQNRRSQN